MIVSGTGLSDAADPVEAAQEAWRMAMRGLGNADPDLAMVFASGGHGSCAESWLPQLPVGEETRLVGCTGMGVLSERGEIEQRDGISVMLVGGDAVEPVPFLIEGGAVDGLVDTLGSYADQAGVLCVMPDHRTFHPADLLGSLTDLGFPIVGAAASGTPMDPRAFQWCGDRVVEGGISGVLLRGDFVSITGVAQGCQPFGQAYAITKAEDNVIQEIAFAPAVDALKEALDVLTPEEKENVGPSIFIGLAMDELASERGRGDFLIRNLVGLSSSDGSITVGDRVEVGQTIQFNRRTPEAAHADLAETVEALKMELGERPARFGLYFNCLGRGYGLFGQPNHDTKEIVSCVGSFPFVGFFGNAELAPVGGRNFVHSYTGGLVVFTD